MGMGGGGGGGAGCAELVFSKKNCTIIINLQFNEITKIKDRDRENKNWIYSGLTHSYLRPLLLNH